MNNNFLQECDAIAQRIVELSKGDVPQSAGGNLTEALFDVWRARSAYERWVRDGSYRAPAISEEESRARLDRYYETGE